tara:strand:+ start:86 stop:1030 length:945 start_codon:yes stop_codon:yes gene_type:complete
MIRNKKILILGGRGFVGKNLLSRIDCTQNSVTVISRKNFFSKAKIIIADLTSDHFKINNLINFDIIFNCSGELKDKVIMDQLHIKAQKKMISFLSKECLRKKKKIRWVQVSSIGVFGFKNKNENIVIDEESIKNPSNYYEKTKLESEKILILGANNFFEYIILRPSTIYGKEMKSDFIFKLNHFIKKGLFFYINSKETLFNMIHIKDVCDALILCAKKSKKNQDFNLSCNYELKEIVKIICEFNKIKQPRFVFRKNLVNFIIKFLRNIINLSLNERIVDILSSKKIFKSSKIENLLGFKSSKKLKEGIIEVLNK